MPAKKSAANTKKKTAKKAVKKAVVKKSVKAKSTKRFGSTKSIDSEFEEGLPKRNLVKRDACPDCGSDNIVFESSMQQLICQECGVLFEELAPHLGEKYDSLELR